MTYLQDQLSTGSTMSQAVSIQTDVAQVLQGQISSAPGQCNNSLLKQIDKSENATFGQVMDDQLANDGSDAGKTSVTTESGGNGKISPADGKSLPQASLNSSKQLKNGDALASDTSPFLFLNQKVTGAQNSSPELLSAASIYPPVQESLPSTDLSSEASSVQGGGDDTTASVSPVVVADISVPEQVNLALNQNPVEHSAARTSQIDMSMLAPGRLTSADSQQLANQLAAPAKQGETDVSTSLANIDRNLQSEINVGITRSIRQFLHFSGNAGYSSLPKSNSIESHFLLSGHQIDSLNTGSVDGYSAGLTQGGQSSSDSRPIPTFQINTPVSNAQWGNEFSDKVRWLVSGNIKKAELSLVPKNLGAIDISISLHNDQTNISINAHNPQSRELIEGSLARLREMFDQAGFGSVNVDISQHSDSNAQSHQAYTKDNHQHNSQDDDMLISSVQLGQRGHTRDNALIDLYA